MDADRDAFLEKIARELRASRVSPAVDSRIMAAVRRSSIARWPGVWMQRRMFVRPLPWSIAATAALLIAGLVGARIGQRTAMNEEGEGWIDGDKQHVQFVLVSPSAKKVSIVGDFNAWDRSQAGYQAQDTGGGVWTLTTPVPVGHYRYSFVVDDTMWVADPNAPAARDHDFGIPKSALVVGWGR